MNNDRDFLSSAPSCLSYFGNKDEAVTVSEIKESRFSLIMQNRAQDYGLHRLAALSQVHGNVGLSINQSYRSTWFDQQGDFLVTKQKGLALFVLTADCIPLILNDPVSRCVGIVHAGWKGSYSGVAQAAIEVMINEYGANRQDIICSFGPSARGCCYEVSPEFMADFRLKFKEPAGFVHRGSVWYFDNSLFLQQILKNFGILAHNINTNNAHCTICNVEFCSFRREKEAARRQLTMVALR